LKPQKPLLMGLFHASPSLSSTPLVVLGQVAHINDALADIFPKYCMKEYCQKRTYRRSW